MSLQYLYIELARTQKIWVTPLQIRNNYLYDLDIQPRPKGEKVNKFYWCPYKIQVIISK